MKALDFPHVSYQSLTSFLIILVIGYYVASRAVTYHDLKHVCLKSYEDLGTMASMRGDYNLVTTRTRMWC